MAEKNRIALGGGFSFIPAPQNERYITGLSASYLYGIKHNLELGLSGFQMFGVENEFIPSLNAGYRFMGQKGLLLRAGISPLYIYFLTSEPNQKKTIVPWPYVSIGYSF